MLFQGLSHIKSQHARLYKGSQVKTGPSFHIQIANDMLRDYTE